MNEITKDILNYKSKGNVFDMGCGKAPVGIELAKKGFTVDAIDISKTKINKLPNEINGVIADLNSFIIEKDYDIFLALGILHLIDKPQKAIRAIKKRTNKSGINIIDAFTNNLNINVLKKEYSKWEILELEVYKDKENNEMVYLIAKKTISE